MYNICRIHNQKVKWQSASVNYYSLENKDLTFRTNYEILYLNEEKYEASS
jgi:hypothetical protein